MRRPARFVALLLLALFAAAGCATPKPKEIPEIYWPNPPIQPRYAFIDYFKNSQELKGQQSAAEGILGGGGEKIFEKPYGIAAAPDGSRVYVSDYGLIHLFDLDKKEVRKIDRKVSWPFGLDVTHDGLLYVTDMEQRKVLVFDPEGNLVRSFGSSKVFDRPSGVAVDEERQRVYVADARKHAILVFDTTGKKIAEYAKGPGAEEGQLYMPSNLALGSDGTIYVSDGGNFRVQVFSPEGEFLRTWGEIGDTPGTFARPKGIALDSEDHVYVIDAAFNNIQIFRKDGQLLLWLGQASEKPGGFLLPSTLSIDDQDRIYVIQQEDPVVQVFQYLGPKYFEIYPEKKLEYEEKLGVTFRFGEEDVEPESPPSGEAAAAAAAAAEAPPEEQETGAREAAAGRGTEVSVSAQEGKKGASPEAALLIQVLELRFGSLTPEQKKKVESADSAKIRTWGTRVLGAETVDDVFSE